MERDVLCFKEEGQLHPHPKVHRRCPLSVCTCTILFIRSRDWWAGSLRGHASYCKSVSPPPRVAMVTKLTLLHAHINYNCNSFFYSHAPFECF